MKHICTRQNIFIALFKLALSYHYFPLPLWLRVTFRLKVGSCAIKIMAHSRLEKIGTIYSRVSGLIKAGAMKLEDRPLWYDIYQAFPPKYPPQYNRPYPDEPVKSIFYPEDQIRAKFYKVMRNAPVMNLSDTEHHTLSQKFIETCAKLKTESNLTSDEAFEKALATIRENVDSKSSQVEKESDEVTELKREPINVKKLFDS